MSTPTTNELQEQISKVDAKFQTTCNQIRLLNRYFEDTKCRISLSHRTKIIGFNHINRLQLSVIEGVRCKYIIYAKILADKLDDLRRRSGYRIIYYREEV